MKSFLISSLIFILLCVACGVGNNPIITATAISGCSAMSVESPICKINLTYNTNGQAGLSLGVISTPDSFTDFDTTGLESCVVKNQANNQVCTFNILYKSGVKNTQYMVFTLGSAKSNSVTVRD
ncbi:MAG: hypothetical protein K2P99_02425 [Burkholderiales bacterium]|nr:hypothetical protein [Burkholderiales bacterium]